MEESNLMKFYSNEKLEGMEIDKDISMEKIYGELKKDHEIGIDSSLTLKINDKNILIKNFDEDFFDIHYGKLKLIHIFQVPVKIKIQNKSIIIISIYHLNYLTKKYEFKNPFLYCEKCNEHMQTFYENLFTHREHEISIEEKNYLNILREADFEKYFKNYNCFGTTFNKPDDFEKNFSYYFKHYDIYKNKSFKLYNDDVRKKIIRQFTIIEQFVGKLSAYFGQTGMGKSISIIGISKYLVDHDLCGTLYINCKCLNELLIKNDYIKFKNIIIDEIPYLFYNDYKGYFSCSNEIFKYNICNDNDLWKLLIVILKYIISNQKSNNPKYYILILDQYNDKIDPQKKLIQICDNYINNTIDKTIGIITFSSMNNKDVKLYKISLLKKLFYKNEDNEHKNLYEINDIIDDTKLKFEDEDIEEVFDSLGRTIKNYNILNNIINDNTNNNKKLTDAIDNCVLKTKTQIENNIKNYYQCYEDEKNIIKLLYFSTETRYDFDSFEEISKHVPFKYFIPEIKMNENSEKYISIKYAFPLIEEVISDLLEYIIYECLNVYKTLIINNDKIDGGARGQLFEKFVTFYLTPKKIRIIKNFFQISSFQTFVR